MEPRNKIQIFARNQLAVARTEKLESQWLGDLMIMPYRGEVVSNEKLPLAKGGESSYIELARVKLPSKLGGKTMRQLVIELCNQNAIQFDLEDTAKAKFTSATTALPGQYASDDDVSSSMTTAEFVPTFVASSLMGHKVIAVSYSLHGDAGLRLDHFHLQEGTANCTDNVNNRHKSLRATEIPNQSDWDLQDEKRAQLLRNACVVMFIEYKQSTDSWSVTRKLSKIKMYLVNPMILNTNGLEIDERQAANFVSVMKRRAKELAADFLGQPVSYTLDEFHKEIRTHLARYNISAERTDIFEHSLLKLAGIDDTPTECHYGPEWDAKPFFVMHLGLSQEVVSIFVKKLQEKFGSDFCQFTPTLNERYDTSTQAVSFLHVEVMRQLPAIKKSIDEILADQRNLTGYQRYSDGKGTFYSELSAKLNLSSIKSTIDLDEAIRAVLSRKAPCGEELVLAQFAQGAGYVGAMMDVYFYFENSKAAAEEFVRKFNDVFSSVSSMPARLVRTNARVKSGSYNKDIDLCEIAIAGELLCSYVFLKEIENEMMMPVEDMPDLVEQIGGGR